ncbi:hypothetical protein TWF694_004598 [Orbilia ellipsospora]|uniref:Uncharacterized protein n=1 Tax=Orbilia ellipsospora TaxID=2528407 RepID=A0AAV9WVQ6_9PEZI
MENIQISRTINHQQQGNENAPVSRDDLSRVLEMLLRPENMEKFGAMLARYPQPQSDELWRMTSQELPPRSSSGSPTPSIGSTSASTETIPRLHDSVHLPFSDFTQEFGKIECMDSEDMILGSQGAQRGGRQRFDGIIIRKSKHVVIGAAESTLGS